MPDTTPFIVIPDDPNAIPVSFVPGGIRFKDAKLILATVVDNGICPDDPRVMTRTNEAIKIVLDYMIPVGGMMTVNVAAIDTILYLPPELENAIEVFPVSADFTNVHTNGKVFKDTDITQGWYQIVNGSTYLDPAQAFDNPLIDHGLWPDADDASVLRRVYEYPGLEPKAALVNVTGAKRFIPIKNDDDFLIVQNLEALKLIIISIERNENSAPDEAQKYRQQGIELLTAEVKKHILDPSHYMRRKAAYHQDIIDFPENSMGWMRAQLALDVDEAMKTGKEDLTWHLLQGERRIMQRGIYKDCVVNVTATVVGGFVFFPLNVQGVLAVDLGGRPIPVRSQFFQHLENGPGMWPCSDMLIDQGDQFFPGSKSMRRKYKLIASCTENQTISAMCKLRWLTKKPHELMVIKNYEALRLMAQAKLSEKAKDWQNALASQQQALDIMDKELADYLAGIKHTVHVQTYGFGLGDVGGIWTR